MKVCGTCETTKADAEFPKDYRYADFRLASSCKACARQRHAKWQKTPAYTQSLARRDPAKLRAAHKRWRDKNVSRERNRSAAWHKSNPDMAAANAGKRRAAVRRACPSWANDFFIDEAYDIAMRRTQATGVRYVVDHIVPLTSSLVCGLHTEHNLQVIPDAINARKGNRWWPDMPE